MCHRCTTLTSFVIFFAVYGGGEALSPALAEDPASATADVDRTVLPIAERGFHGIAECTLGGSKPDYPAPVTAPAGAPNVLLILLDDAGFGNPSTFGGPVQTPTFEKLASQGLRYNRFHVTGLCSPTRAALLSGAIITP